MLLRRPTESVITAIRVVCIVIRPVLKHTMPLSQFRKRSSVCLVSPFTFQQNYHYYVTEWYDKGHSLYYIECRLLIIIIKDYTFLLDILSFYPMKMRSVDPMLVQC